jgi:hypothetical protein
LLSSLRGKAQSASNGDVLPPRGELDRGLRRRRRDGGGREPLRPCVRRPISLIEALAGTFILSGIESCLVVMSVGTRFCLMVPAAALVISARLGDNQSCARARRVGCAQGLPALDVAHDGCTGLRIGS